jgi:hypothetical protein
MKSIGEETEVFRSLKLKTPAQPRSPGPPSKATSVSSSERNARNSLGARWSCGLVCKIDHQSKNRAAFNDYARNRQFLFTRHVIGAIN